MLVDKRWASILANALEGVAVEPTEHAPGPDVLVRARDGRTIAFEVKWAGEGWPQDVRDAARDVKAPWPAQVVLLARRLSPGAIEWLREIGANWADETGRTHIKGPDGLIVIREPTGRAPSPRPGMFAWSQSATDLGELILSREAGPLHGAALAKASGWSVPQVAKVLKAFDGQGWTVKRGGTRGPTAYRELVDPDAMLGSWSGAIGTPSRPARLAHRATRDVLPLLSEELAPVLDRDTRWAVSGWAGLELTAPFATTTPSLHVYVADADFAGTLSGVIESARLREVEEGGRITFWPAPASALSLATRHARLPVVSAPRLFADLTSFGARGLDAAEHVKQQLIDPLHTRTPPEGDSDG